MKKIFQFALFLTLYATVPAVAQTDVSQQIKELPDQDGTYLLTMLEGIKFYAVKKGGKIIEFRATDEAGNLIPGNSEDASGKTGTRSAKKNDGSTPTKPTTPVCVDKPDQICRWSDFSKRCVCISTVLK